MSNGLHISCLNDSTQMAMQTLGTCERCTRPDTATLVLALGGALHNPRGEQSSFLARQGPLEVTLIGGRMLICADCNDAYNTAVQAWLSNQQTVSA